MFTPNTALSFSPMVLLQGSIVLGGTFLIFLLLFTLRDMLLRTRSFWYQALCVLIVGALPVVGFLLYLLIRPARTIKQRETEEMLKVLTSHSSPLI